MKQFQLTNADVGIFCRALSHLLQAGISPGDAFYLLAEDETRPEHRALLQKLAADTDSGHSLAGAIGNSACFPEYVCGLLLVGEQVGRIPETLEALAQHYEGRTRLERHMRAALLYPAVLMAVLLAVVIVLLVWVLPIFDDVYAQLGSRLTGAAGGLLAIGRFLRGAMPVMCLLLILLAAAAWATALHQPIRQKLQARWRARSGGRGITGRLQTARFAQAMAMTLRSGMPGEEAVALAARLAEGNAEHQAQCDACLRDLEAGASLPRALRDHGLLPASACRLLEAGVRSGSSDRVMDQIARELLEESEEALALAAGKVEPVLVVALSLLVGAILFSVLLPLANILSTIG